MCVSNGAFEELDGDDDKHAIEMPAGWETSPVLRYGTKYAMDCPRCHLIHLGFIGCGLEPCVEVIARQKNADDFLKKRFGVEAFEKHCKEFRDVP